MKTVRLGVLGAGYWGTKLCREYLSLSTQDASLDRIADPSEHRLKTLQTQLNSNHAKFCTDYRKVLKDPSIDAVHIAVPSHLHYEVARASLESGKHVLIEKPMTTSSREAFKLAALSEGEGLVLQVGHIFRFNNALREVRKLVVEGALGKILYTNLVWATHMEPPSDRDIIFDLAPHPIDVLNYLLDEWPVNVYATGRSYLRKEAGKEEAAFINLEFPNDVLVHVYVSWIHPGVKERSVQLVGEKASLKCDALNQSVIISTGDGETLRKNVLPNNTIQDMQLHFLDRIRGRGPQLNSPLVGVTTVQVLEATVYSMKSRSPVSLSFP